MHPRIRCGHYCRVLEVLVAPVVLAIPATRIRGRATTRGSSKSSSSKSSSSKSGITFSCELRHHVVVRVHHCLSGAHGCLEACTELLVSSQGTLLLSSSKGKGCKMLIAHLCKVGGEAIGTNPIIKVGKALCKEVVALVVKQHLPVAGLEAILRKEDIKGLGREVLDVGVVITTAELGTQRKDIGDDVSTLFDFCLEVGVILLILPTLRKEDVALLPVRDELRSGEVLVRGGRRSRHFAF